ncbi:MAG: UTP--glucose-1-phosphate uridylyltransferase [Planctomycetota bacterium]|jgi:UDP-N-acetylglucosamine/UDP-N-acetylgalactosamine diphosphorylase
MIARKPPENVTLRLKQHNQSHLLAFWGQLDAAGRQNLLAQIESLDFSQIDLWVANLVRNPTPAELTADLAAAPCYAPTPEHSEQTPKYAHARELGRKLISAGKVAAFVVAGGQGTRLGFDGPKGNFPTSPVKNKTLFQMFAETIAAASQKYQVTCPWYIMTSPLNHDETKRIFRKNRYFGLAEENVFIFQQGALPNFGLNGKILLAGPADIACSPDGHGGSLKALFRSGAIEDMKKRGIQFISYFQVDNPLINIFDPLFIGLHALDDAEMSSKALIKTGPKEKVGNFCLADGKVTVIEYSDLPDELAEKRNRDGSLLFQLASIAIHIINTTFVEKLNAEGFSLPLHRALKKIPHIDERGNLVEPTEPNGVKLETFVFDALPLASKSVILETLRSEEFAPLKNAVGADSVETARRMMAERAANWLESAGVKIPRKSDHSPDCLIEIAPGFALEKDDLKQELDRMPDIKPGDSLYLV